MEIVVLFLTLSLLFFLTYQANRRLDSIRTGYLLIDLPVLAVVLSLTLLYELSVSLLPTSAGYKQKIQGRVALVTGAGSGIGRATSLELSREGCVLILWDINTAGNEETGEMIERNGGKVFTYTVDVSDRTALEQTAETVLREHTRVDILICNAGIVNISLLHKLENERIEKLIAINFTSVVWLTKFFLQRMVDQDYGHIVCTSSMVAMRGFTHVCDYSVSKAALSSYAISLMGELDKIDCKTVHVCVVYPATVNTPLVQKVLNIIPDLYSLKVDYVARQMVNGILLKRQFVMLPRAQRVFHCLNFLIPVSFNNFILKQFNIGNVMREFEKLK